MTDLRIETTLRSQEIKVRQAMERGDEIISNVQRSIESAGEMSRKGSLNPSMKTKSGYNQSRKESQDYVSQGKKKTVRLKLESEGNVSIHMPSSDQQEQMNERRRSSKKRMNSKESLKILSQEDSPNQKVVDKKNETDLKTSNNNFKSLAASQTSLKSSPEAHVIELGTPQYAQELRKSIEMEVKKRESKKNLDLAKGRKSTQFEIARNRRSNMSHLPPLTSLKSNALNLNLKPTQNFSTREQKNNLTSKRLSTKFDIVTMETEFKKIMKNKDIETSIKTYKKVDKLLFEAQFEQKMFNIQKRMQSRFNSVTHRVKTDLLLETARRRKNQEIVLNVLPKVDEPHHSPLEQQIKRQKTNIIQVLHKNMFQAQKHQQKQFFQGFQKYNHTESEVSLVTSGNQGKSSGFIQEVSDESHLQSQSIMKGSLLHTEMTQPASLPCSLELDSSQVLQNISMQDIIAQENDIVSAQIIALSNSRKNGAIFSDLTELKKMTHKVKQEKSPYNVELGLPQHPKKVNKSSLRTVNSIRQQPISVVQQGYKEQEHFYQEKRKIAKGLSNQSAFESQNQHRNSQIRARN